MALYALHFHALRPGTAFRTVDLDPELAYFVSSVAVWEGQPYLLVQHPGTPVLVAGTAVTALLTPFIHWPRSIAAAFVARPELFIVPVHAVMLAASLAVVVCLGRRLLGVRRRSDAVLAAALSAAYFAFLPDAFRWAFYWSHNAVAFAGGTALSLAVLVAHRRGRPVTMGTAAWLGVAGGALVATQLFFASWLVALAVTVAALPLMRDGARGGGLAARLAVTAALGAAVSFALWFIPALPGARVFIDFVRAFTTHQGRYGGGPPGFTSWPVLRANLETVWSYSPALLAAEMLAIAAVLAALRGRGAALRGWRAGGLGLVVQWTITLLLIAKHPSPFYVSALAALFPPLLAVAFALWRDRGGPARIACAAAAALVLAATAVNLAGTVAHDTQRSAFRAAMDGEVAEQRRRSAVARGMRADEVLILWGPGLRDAGCYALWMGDQYSAHALAPEISRVCPSEGLIWSNVVVVPEGWVGRHAPALVVTSESSPRLYPAFAALGAPAIGSHPDAEGLRLAFFDVTLDGGRVVPSALPLREVP